MTKSPITGKEMKLMREESTLHYQKEEFLEHFTDDRLDTLIWPKYTINTGKNIQFDSKEVD